MAGGTGASHRGPCAAEVGCALVEAREEDGGAAVKLARSVVVARTVALLERWRSKLGREKKMALLFVVAGEEMAAAAAMVGGRRGEN